ncbi:MAG: hypothetical protein LBR53_09640 [Deltaproteobacteria bacterium]|jgi:hypothetical protein|nr:hypothetical protein [Deltaproteobacteria bacterium]
MRKTFLKALFLLFLSLFLSQSAFSQSKPAEAADPSELFTGRAKRKTIKHRVCPETKAMSVAMKYPVNTGNPEVDGFFEKLAEGVLHDAESEYDWVITEDYICESAAEPYSAAEFASYKAGPYTLGVLYAFDEYTSGPHGNQYFKSYNFDLRSGSEIQVKDLFPRTPYSLARLFLYAYSDLCFKTPRHEPADNVFDKPCGEGPAPSGDFLNTGGPLDNLGHMVLTSRGATLNFEAYQIWSYAQGPYELVIPRKLLLKMGAADLWGENPPGPDGGRTGQGATGTSGSSGGAIF